MAVTAVHLWLAGAVLPDRLGDGAADRLPRRIEVAFVRELHPVLPAAVLAPRPRRAVAPLRAPAQAASAAAVEAAAELPPGLLATAPPEEAPDIGPDPDAAAAADPGASSPAAPQAAQSEGPEPVAAPPDPAAVPEAAVAFEWPPSTRLSYRLSGHYRGPVEGQAQVEWLRAGDRYQVHMALSIGPAFAPLISRRVASEGEITPDGLRPRRYDEETRIVLRPPRRLVIFLDADSVLLPDGRLLPRPAGVQDSASQFVQLTWLFTTRPELLRPGVSIELPLALPRHLQTWTYDVLAAEMLATPAGEVEALHVKPRRPPRPGGDLVAELWVAPGLQNLPVRMVIRQDGESYVDLLIERLPQQAAPGR